MVAGMVWALGEGKLGGFDSAVDGTEGVGCCVVLGIEQLAEKEQRIQTLENVISDRLSQHTEELDSKEKRIRDIENQLATRDSQVYLKL